jgi:predicted cobalt transporter CbtA
MTEKPGGTTPFPRKSRYRVLVAAVIVFSLVVAGAAGILVADSLAHGWLWGLVGFAVVVTLAALAGIPLVRYGMRHPEVSGALITADARATSGFPIRRSSD